MVLYWRTPLPPLMAAILLDGEALAAKERGRVGKACRRPKSVGVTPGLGTILVGDDGPSARYVAMKHQDCAEIGVESVHEELPGDISQAQLESVVRRSARTRKSTPSSSSCRCRST